MAGTDADGLVHAAAAVTGNGDGYGCECRPASIGEGREGEQKGCGWGSCACSNGRRNSGRRSAITYGGETADGQGARLTRDAINGARLDAMLSTDMQRGTMLVQMDDGALHQEEERARQKATRRACMGAGARCKVQGAREMWSARK
jgi:hypothetical protein